MDDDMKAKEILDYCIQYLGQKPNKKLYEEMKNEIVFMLTTD